MISAGSQINSSNMLWSLSGSLSLVYKVLFGMQYQGERLVFRPFVPAAFAGHRSTVRLLLRQPPEGARVRMEVVEDDFDDVPPPHTTETREEFLDSLREGIAEAKAGGGRPAREVLREIAIKHNLPLLPGE